MFGLFKKKVKADDLDQQDIMVKTVAPNNSTANSSLNPPKNLPDLAKDMFTVDSPVPVRQVTDASPARMPEPVTNVQPPKLDLSLLRQNVDVVQTTQPKTEPITKDVIPIIREPIKDRTQLDKETQNYIANYINNILSMQHSSGLENRYKPNVAASSRDTNNGIYRDSGFFKDIEDRVMRGGNIHDYLTSNIIEKMNDYHHGNNESSSNLSELQNLEHLWVISKQREETARRLTMDVESEIRYKADNLRTSITNVQPNLPNVRQEAKFRPMDIFNILKKKPLENTQTENQDSHQAAQNTYYPNIYIDDPGKYFYFKDGDSIRSVDQLIEKLNSIKQEVFDFHVSGERNDFANWIDGVFRLHILAGLMRNAKSIDDMSRLLILAKEKNYLF